MMLCVVRHGETDFNVMGKYAGCTDIPINQTGINQAEELAEKLKEKRFDIIVSSPLLRAKQTAEIVCRVLNAPFLVYEQFAERNLGVYEGLTREEAEEKYPDLWARSCTRKLDDAPTNGETIRQFDIRITEGIIRLHRDYPRESVLLICHGFVSRLINRYCTGLSYDEMHGFSLGNCEIAEYVLKRNGPD